MSELLSGGVRVGDADQGRHGQAHLDDLGSEVIKLEVVYSVGEPASRRFLINPPAGPHHLGRIADDRSLGRMSRSLSPPEAFHPRFG